MLLKRNTLFHQFFQKIQIRAFRGLNKLRIEIKKLYQATHQYPQNKLTLNQWFLLKILTKINNFSSHQKTPISLNLIPTIKLHPNLNKTLINLPYQPNNPPKRNYPSAAASIRLSNPPLTLPWYPTSSIPSPTRNPIINMKIFTSLLLLTLITIIITTNILKDMK